MEYMKKILITFIGNADCQLDNGREGPILGILKQLDFDQLYILYDKEKYLPHASNILLYCRKYYPRLQVSYKDALVQNPSDYSLVYPAMLDTVNQILVEEGKQDVEYAVSVTSGTPVMHACWLLIVQSGQLKARLIQSSREEGIREIDLSLDDFPQITSQNQLKLRLTRYERDNKALRRQFRESMAELIGEDESIRRVRDKIASLCEYDIAVFISGESGTGKEVVAKLLHFTGNRKQGPFIAVNCGSISENLFESEFFGHKKGSFTSAISDHEGFFSQADGGTLFLDEVGELPLSQQVKFLRVLETGMIQPLGGKPKKVNVQIITASNKDLPKKVREGSFREELFYRIVQEEIRLSPLRERGMDIILLARHFLADPDP